MVYVSISPHLTSWRPAHAFRPSTQRTTILSRSPTTMPVSASRHSTSGPSSRLSSLHRQHCSTCRWKSSLPTPAEFAYALAARSTDHVRSPYDAELRIYGYRDRYSALVGQLFPRYQWYLGVEGHLWRNIRISVQCNGKSKRSELHGLCLI